MTENPLRVGFIGTGRISDLHAIEYQQNPGAKIVALCDRNTDIARQRAASWGIDDVDIYEDHQELLRNGDVDLVEILLPHHLHLPVALEAIGADKIVSLQKPMCMNMTEADQLVSAASASARPFKVFENFVFYPPVMKARELLTEGAIGEPLSIRIKSNPGKSESAWDVPKEANAWRQKASKAGGGPLVFDDGHHKFALAWYFMGNPQQVHAFIGETQTSDGSWFDAQSIISFRFPGNRIGNLEVVYSPELEIASRHYAQDDRVEITGSKGVLWINCGHGSIGDPAPLVHYADGKVTEYRDIASGWEHSFIQSTRHFLNVLSDGGEPCLSAEQARDILRFALAAEESAGLGKSVFL